MYEGPEFKHCKVIDPKADAQGKSSNNPLVKCEHCANEFSAGAYRIRGQILGIRGRGGGNCLEAPQDAKDLFQAIENEKAAATSKKRKRDDLDQLTANDGSATAPSTAGSTGPVQIGIKQAFSNSIKADADAAVCRYFYAEGTPFVKIESPYFLDMLQKVALFGAGYRPPPLKRLRTDGIDKEKALLDKDLEVRSASHRTATLEYCACNV